MKCPPEKFIIEYRKIADMGKKSVTVYCFYNGVTEGEFMDEAPKDKNIYQGSEVYVKKNAKYEN